MHRYEEIKEFPRALNISQMWNWSTRMFITEAKAKLEKQEEGGDAQPWTKEEVAELEKFLIEHETWLNDVVEKQKRVKMDEDPAVESSEIRTKAKALENRLQKLVRKKVPKKKSAKSSTSKASETATSTTATTSATGSVPEEQGTPAGHHDEL